MFADRLKYKFKLYLCVDSEIQQVFVYKVIDSGIRPCGHEYKPNQCLHVSMNISSAVLHVGMSISPTGVYM